MGTRRLHLAWALAAVAVAGRLLPHPANVTPVGALAIWGGSRLPRWQALAVVIGSMVVADWFIGFHGSMPQVYATLALTTLAASIIQPRGVIGVAGFTVAGAVVFFLSTNFVFYPWQTPHLYPPTWAGQTASYVAALPFARNSLVGDLAYVSLFYGCEWLANRLKTTPRARHIRHTAKEVA